jgi:hypothetical protein
MAVLGFGARLRAIGGPEISANQRRTAPRTKLRVGLRSGAAFLANGGVAGAHDSQRLGGVAGFERLVIRVRDLSRLPIELELAERIDGRDLASSGMLRFPLRD